MSDERPAGSEPRMNATGATGAELMDQLRSTLERANELVRALETNIRRADRWRPVAGEDPRADELERRLEKTEADVEELAAQLATSERQTSRLMNLYVATYQLHATLLPAEVQSTIAEIAVNLLGAERFALLLRGERASEYEVALAEGFDVDTEARFAGGVYRGGDPLVDDTLNDGVLRLGEDAPNLPIAVVPLRVQGEIVGALVILKLLDHKPSLRGEDRELLDLLSAHAASALFAARMFASTDRRLRSLESLVKLARGE